MALPVNNLPISSILSTLNVMSQKAKDIFYNSNGALKSELELGDLVNGSLNTSYCTNLATLRIKRNLAAFKGYSSTSLNLSVSSVSMHNNELGIRRIEVSGVIYYTLKYNTSILNVSKYGNYFNVSWKTANTSTFLIKNTTVTVIGGGKSQVLTVMQLVKPYINDLPSRPHVSNQESLSFSKAVFPIDSNYGKEWNVISSNPDFWADIKDVVGELGKVLCINYVPRLEIGNNNKHGTTIITIELGGMVYSLDVSGEYIFNDNGYVDSEM